MIIDPYTWQELPIQHLTPLTDDTLSVQVPKPPGYTYRAGQYAVIRVRISGTPLLRQYSFASAPANDFLEFLIQREPEGIVTNWFHDHAAVGTHIEISQPFGSFVIESGPHPTLLIAGRIGVAPFVSMVRNELAQERGENLTLLYSARGVDRFCYPELFRSINVAFFDTEAGKRINEATLAGYLAPSTRVYLCGSKQFVDSLGDQLRSLGLEPEHLRRELFTLQ